MKTKINTYFEEQIAACQAASAALVGDNRPDEAVFEKIRMNVFNIFRQVYSAGERAGNGDPEKQMDFLRKQLENIPSSWRASLDTAEAHGNREKAHIESIKLEVVEEICRKVSEWSEEK